METTVIGPPFAGIQDRPDERGIQIVGMSGLLPDNGMYVTAPAAAEMDSLRGGSHGIFIWGVREGAIVVTIHRNATTNRMIYVASRDSFRVTADLTDLFGEDPPRDEPYWFATLGRRLYFGGGQQVFQCDRGTLFPSVMVLTEGIESQTVPYLKNGSIPARWACVYQGRMYYVLSETVNFSTHMTIDPNDPDPRVQAVNPDGSVGYGPQQILFSDPLRPACVQWYAAWDIDDDGCEVTSLVAHESALLILTTKGLWALAGDTTFTLTQISKYADCVAPASAVSVGGTVLWFGANAIWRYEGGVIARVPNTEFIFGGVNSLVTRILTAGKTSSTNTPYLSRTVACATCGGKWYAAVIPHFGGLTVELLTNAIGLVNTITSFGGVQVHNVYIADVATSRLMGNSSGLLIGYFAELQSAIWEDSRTNAWATLQFRFCPNVSSRISIVNVKVKLSATPNGTTVGCGATEEFIRYGGNTAPHYQSYMDIRGVPCGNEEGSAWADGTETEPKWVGTPASGQVRPRFVGDFPYIATFTPKGVGSDLVMVFGVQAPTVTAIEQIVIEYNTEPAP